MAEMFDGRSSLTSVDVSSFDTSSTFSMNYLFRDCELLTKLDLSSFNTSNVDTLSDLFDGCSALTHIKLGERFAFTDGI